MTQVNYYVNASNSASIVAEACTVEGMYVNNTSSGTLVLYDNAGNPLTTTISTTVISGTITPGIGYHRLGNIRCYAGLAVAFGGTSLDITFHIAKNF